MNRGPVPTVDVIIEIGEEIVLIRRKHPPPGWAIPGGFVDAGERAENAAVREAQEETGLSVTLTALLGVYSDPGRDPRRHTISIVYVARLRQAVARYDAALVSCLHSADEKLTELELIIQEIR